MSRYIVPDTRRSEAKVKERLKLIFGKIFIFLLHTSARSLYLSGYAAFLMSGYAELWELRRTWVLVRSRNTKLFSLLFPTPACRIIPTVCPVLFTTECNAMRKQRLRSSCVCKTLSFFHSLSLCTHLPI